ncbi:MAG: S24/S26 family peptidase [Clostridia bacterium]|nr:S24/S26 family peptidase [Clostridia bacterium]
MRDENSFIGADVALKEKEEVAILTTGISMRPMLREHRDVVIIERVNRPLRENDVPLYRRPNSNKFVLHRIVKVKKDGFVIRGDNLLINEYSVRKEDIIGVLKAFYRDGKYVDCATDKKYKLYVLYNRASFPARLLWRKYLRPFLGKIKHIFLK